MCWLVDDRWLMTQGLEERTDRCTSKDPVDDVDELASMVVTAVTHLAE